jgi:hypothetical protein
VTAKNNYNKNKIYSRGKRQEKHSAFCITDGGKNLLSFYPDACSSLLPIPDMLKMQLAGASGLQLLQYLRLTSKSTDCFKNLPQLQNQNSGRIAFLP